MTRAWWPLGCAAAFLLCANAGTAKAQNFIVLNAPAGSAVEVSFGPAVGKGAADQAGNATVVVTGSPAETQELAAAIYADACGTDWALYGDVWRGDMPCQECPRQPACNPCGPDCQDTIPCPQLMGYRSPPYTLPPPR